ncbi:MAG: ribonuclease P protein component [Sulfurimonas sp. RIFOXYD12_FULL_33_39]|nr:MULTISPECIES: ribonuclease P protein component [unclassified Sulfurimonas]OHE04017.1 MAG: ribonuclease P protein component [Sulfurimonas sp. RIFCSPLOWO2_12_FULL_34_6]OHE08746.1 MAG: ribonuclease P protein component [Sulfurimonas sp. RIFOXYD12_FULL_33_39]OHE14031.1 MAG: ribonuclease P protein component [Sulfurimonas sp. RIFOXYD2_FULL_34_21]DAB27637.1 MAG TPA: ribonuclease P protein component [Sulfurimonas sp. UBA10385]
MKQHREFQYVYRKGKDAHSNSVVLFFLPANEVHKVGFTATKKIGNAVKRNRAKRRLRALFLEYSSLLNDGTYIFVAKQAINEETHQKLKNDFEKILNRSNAIKKEIND